MKLIEDLKKINTLDDDQFAALLKSINSNELLSFKELSEFETSCISNNIIFEDAKTIVKVLNFICDILFQKRDSASALSYFENSFLESAKKDPDAQRAWTRIKDNINNLPSFYLFRKKEKLRNILPKLEEFSVICDARPVFDSTKTIMDYLFPLILKVESEDRTLLCELTEEQLSEMQIEIDYAKHKIATLRSKIVGNPKGGNSNE